MSAKKTTASPRVLPLARRRAAVLANYLAYPIMGLFMAELLTDSKFVNIAGILLTSFLIMGTFIYLYVDTNLWNLGNAPDKDLDERQIQVRDNAYRYAYMGLATGLLLGGIYYTLAVDKALWLPSTYDQANYFLWGIILLTLTLPSAILAWTEPEV